jgi:hypothetical protein
MGFIIEYEQAENFLLQIRLKVRRLSTNLIVGYCHVFLWIVTIDWFLK